MRRIGRSTLLFLSLPAVISPIMAAIPAGIPRTTTRNGAKLMEFSYARIERSGTVSINNLLSSIVDCSWRVVHFRRPAAKLEGSLRHYVARRQSQADDLCLVDVDRKSVAWEKGR